GDVYKRQDLHSLYDLHKKSGKVVTLTAVHPIYKYGLVEMEGDLIMKFDEKPNMKDLINGGFMVFNKKVFDYLSPDKNCILEQEPMRNLAKDNELVGYKHQGFWKSMDTQKDVDELNEIFKKGCKNNGAPWEIWKKNRNNTNILKGIGSDKKLISSNKDGIWNKKDDELNNYDNKGS
ncbi:hypothetical protein GOV12_01030, partial [Candidatus Pacearchaeota archaeon]|nr:hypothetical protein [Candidatus Pacearchaeota archaeon]